MLPDRVSNPGPLTYESGALPIALRGPALSCSKTSLVNETFNFLTSSHFCQKNARAFAVQKFFTIFQQKIIITIEQSRSRSHSK